MFEFVFFVLTCAAFLSLVTALVNGERRIDCDPFTEEFAHIFAAVLSVGLTIAALKVGDLQFAVLGGILPAGLAVEHIKERC